jgi:hypothetical protein
MTSRSMAPTGIVSVRAEMHGGVAHRTVCRPACHEASGGGAQAAARAHAIARTEFDCADRLTVRRSLSRPAYDRTEKDRGCTRPQWPGASIQKRINGSRAVDPFAL